MQTRIPTGMQRVQDLTFSTKHFPIMAKRRLIIALLTPLALMAAASSPTDIPVEGSVMSLEQCRQLALTNNKNLRRSAQQIKVAGYEKDQAFAAYLPAIDFAGGYMYNQKGVSVFSSDQLLRRREAYSSPDGLSAEGRFEL